MRFQILMLLSLPLIALFAIAVHAADWDNPDGLSADQLISGGDQGTYAPIDSSLAATPKKSRDTWSNRTGVNFTMPKTLSENALTPKGSRSNAETTSTSQDQSANTNGTETTTQTPVTTQATPSTPTASGSIAGSWSFELEDNTLKNMILTLFQSGDAVFGTGSIKEENNTPLTVAASGSVNGEKLNLDLTTLGSINLYRVTLTTGKDSASGDYQAFSANGNTWTGSASGTRSSQ